MTVARLPPRFARMAVLRGVRRACLCLRLWQSMAKEILHSRKAVSRLYTNRAQMMGIGTALTEQLGERLGSRSRCLGCRLPGRRSSARAVHVRVCAPVHGRQAHSADAGCDREGSCWPSCMAAAAAAWEDVAWVR